MITTVLVFLYAFFPNEPLFVICLFDNQNMSDWHSDLSALAIAATGSVLR